MSDYVCTCCVPTVDAVTVPENIVRWPQDVHAFTPRTNKKHGKECGRKSI
jgi:hypothetical protein